MGAGMFSLWVSSLMKEAIPRLERFGLKLSLGGAHSSRTMMLDEISRLLSVITPDADYKAYQEAVLINNLLGKKTAATREKTFRYLRELYGLSLYIPIFKVYRQLCDFDHGSIPLLSLLISLARDPQFRATADVVLASRASDTISGELFQQAIVRSFGDRYSSNNIGKISRNAASSWTQSGHLTGHTNKIRTIVKPGPVALAFALILSHVGGWHGEQLFTSDWCKILDLNSYEARSLGIAASRQGLISLKGIDSIIEITFPMFQHEDLGASDRRYQSS